MYYISNKALIAPVCDRFIVKVVAPVSLVMRLQWEPITPGPACAAVYRCRLRLRPMLSQTRQSHRSHTATIREPGEVEMGDLQL